MRSCRSGCIFRPRSRSPLQCRCGHNLSSRLRQRRLLLLLRPRQLLPLCPRTRLLPLRASRRPPALRTKARPSPRAARRLLVARQRPQSRGRASSARMRISDDAAA
eukprot:Amastigsp_a853_21.p3 type:complete len:106 gc:universal Amastigsp_a853_21:478-795(+)